MKVRVLSLLPVCLYSFLYFCWRVLYSVLDKESVDLKVLVPSNKFRCKTSLLTAVRTRREQYTYLFSNFFFQKNSKLFNFFTFFPNFCRLFTTCFQFSSTFPPTFSLFSNSHILPPKADICQETVTETLFHLTVPCLSSSSYFTSQ